MKNKHWHKLSLILLVVLFIFPFTTAKAETRRVVRVGYTLIDGMFMKDNDENYYGYDYDYLMQIAQYTGWEYEFVEVKGTVDEQILKLMDMLKNGEIDLMGSTRYFDSMTKDYDYANEPYGSSYNVLAVKNDSELIDTNTLITKGDLKVAVLKTATTRRQALKQFAQTSGISYQEIECESEDELIAKYDAHEVDAILLTDLALPKDFHSISNFSPTSFYFVTTKGNSQIISELNQAQVNINKINPTLSSDLYNRYFNTNTKNFELNASETAYLKEHKDLNVLICSGTSPIRYGVGMDILNKLGEEIDVNFHYTYAKNFDDCKKKARSDDYDIVLGLPYEISLSDTMDLRMSDPYLRSNVLLVTNRSISPNELDNKKQGITPYDVSLFDTNNNLKYYESMEEILDAINNHEIDYAYANTYMFTYYMNKNAYKNISNFNTADYLRTQYVFGVAKKEDLSLLSILNKAIRVQKDDIDGYIYKNAYVEREFDLSAFLYDHMLIILCAALITIILIIHFIRSYYAKQLQMKKAIELEYKRYQLLSDLSGEMSFTYDYLEDSMKISAIGIGKLAEDEVIYNYTIAVQDTHRYPDILRVIASYLVQAKDVTCEEETRMMHNGANWYQLSIKIIESTHNNKTTAIYAVGKVLDIQKEKAEREQLRIKSETDTLTGIMNRGAAQDAITKRLAECKEFGALIMIDLDNFKDVNDSYGHLEGDRVLIETAQLLLTIFKQYIVARLGGDEFIIYMDDIDKEQVRRLSQEALSQIKHLPCMKDRDITLSMSIGIVFTTCSRDFVTLMKMADQMLYEVKRNGRNNAQIYEKEN